MAQEIERKFLVTSDGFKAEASRRITIIQGYLSSLPERSVRIRIKGSKGYITIKGAGNSSGVTRFEWEKEIPLPEAKELLNLCEPGIIEKTRFEVITGKHTFEVDEFYGENLGLMVAEVELSAEEEAYEKPEWLGQEVTGDPRYFNSMLMKHPYTRW